jgi:hypothetical protein
MRHQDFDIVLNIYGKHDRENLVTLPRELETHPTYLESSYLKWQIIVHLLRIFRKQKK